MQSGSLSLALLTFDSYSLHFYIGNKVFSQEMSFSMPGFSRSGIYVEKQIGLSLGGGTLTINQDKP